MSDTEVIETIDQDLPASLLKVIHDLSGVLIEKGADLIRHVPVLAAAAQTLDLPGKDKLATVMRAGHALVEKYVPSEERAATHALIDTVFPATVNAVLDVSKGRVSIGGALKTTAMTVVQDSQTQAVALGLLQRCLSCITAPPTPSVHSKAV